MVWRYNISLFFNILTVLGTASYQFLLYILPVQGSTYLSLWSNVVQHFAVRYHHLLIVPIRKLVQLQIKISTVYKKDGESEVQYYF